MKRHGTLLNMKNKRSQSENNTCLLIIILLYSGKDKTVKIEKHTNKPRGILEQ